MNKKVKDSLFTHLLSDKSYALEAYLALHPENKNIKEEDIEIITLENVLTNNFYNDFGMSIKDQQIIFIEAQSKWSINILIRILIYYVNSLIRDIQDKKLNIFSTKKIPLQPPEFYVVYSGKKKVKNEISLAEEYFGNRNSFIDLKIKVIKKDTVKKHDLFDQYITFCTILEEERQKHGYTLETIKECIRRCKELNILKKYLSEHEAEVIDMIDLIFSQELADELAREEAIEEGREQGREQGIQEGKAKGKEEALLQTAINLKKQGIDIEVIVKATGLTKEAIEAL